MPIGDQLDALAGNVDQMPQELSVYPVIDFQIIV
jgi:hypothetical protein